MIKTDSGEICIDPAEPVLHIIGKKYAIFVLSVLGNDNTRKNFNDMKKAIPGISGAMLSARLHDMIAAGLIERYDGDIVTYDLTDRGRELRKRLLPVFEYFADR
ncbi:transcriptional regulator [Thermoplasma sp. Kam2015]|uniref:winged helix-turn-helix transcriptional regulator n=1 Tax=Thermoplasma sp. Kam2015 TaxID=2094122 RepID=UPI000D9023C0|nr:helix-turn-helix domain-containing protein [Thermoplasma sp. Kam2015]PYB68882.1 transcriptional regulator [Thermoplasma sp. Kam2015]